jgi:hypothetical protein
LEEVWKLGWAIVFAALVVEPEAVVDGFLAGHLPLASAIIHALADVSAEITNSVHSERDSNRPCRSSTK